MYISQFFNTGCAYQDIIRLNNDEDLSVVVTGEDLFDNVVFDNDVVLTADFKSLWWSAPALHIGYFSEIQLDVKE